MLNNENTNKEMNPIPNAENAKEPMSLNETKSEAPKPEETNPSVPKKRLSKSTLLAGAGVAAVILLTILTIWFVLKSSPTAKEGVQPTAKTQPVAKQSPPPSEEKALPEEDPQVKSLENVSSSDEVSSIEKDLKDTNLNAIDQELNDLESSLKEFSTSTGQ